MSDNANKCSIRVRLDGRWPTYRNCKLPAVTCVEGRWYCRTHSPKEVANRASASMNRYRAKTIKEIVLPGAYARLGKAVYDGAGDDEINKLNRDIGGVLEELGRYEEPRA